MKNGNRKRILIVENNDRMLTTFRTLLEEAGFNTEVTWSGRDALAALETERFDLLLTDGYLPDLHLTEFLDRINRSEIRLGIVVMQSPLPKRAVARRYQKLGAFAVVDKREHNAVCHAVAALCNGAKSPMPEFTVSPAGLGTQTCEYERKSPGG